MKTIIHFLILSILGLVASCSNKESIFEQPIQKERGQLRVMNPDGFIGAVSVGTSLDYEVTVKSIGGLDVRNINVSLVTSAPITFKGGTFPGTGGTCDSDLRSGETCSIILSFAPTTLASHVANLQFTYSDVLASSSYNFTVSADSHPILTFEYGSQYDFGNKFVGSSTDLRIRIRNSGRVIAEDITINNLNAPFRYKGGTYPGTGGTCGSRIVVGASCEIIINYAPTSNGQHLQDIRLNYLNTGRAESNTLNLIAWGFYEAQLSISAITGDDFGTVPTSNSNTKTFTVTHTGGDVAANAITLSNLAAPFSRAGGTCGTVLTIDQGSCTIILALNSASSSTWSNTFTFSYFNGTRTVSVNKTLTGITRHRPVLTLNRSGTVSFANTKVGTTTTLPFTVTYSSGELPATGISLSGLSAPFSISSTTCGSTLSSGSCTINVTFTPTTWSTWGQGATFTYNNTIANVTTSLTLSAKSEGRLTSSSLAFGTVVAGQTKALSVRLDFLGGAELTNISVQSLTGPYTFTSGSYPGNTTSSTRCGTSISASYCNVYLTFSPPTEGTFNNTLVLTYHNGVDEGSMTLNISGTGSPAAVLTAQDKDYGSTPINSTVAGASLVRVTNSSSMNATSVSYATLPVGFSYRGGNFPGTSGNCSSIIIGNSYCNLDILFTPVTATSYSGTFSLTYYDGTVTRTTTAILTGIGITSDELYISSFDRLSFSNKYVGQTPYETKTLTIGHGGTSIPATINSKTILGVDFNIVSDSCPSSLVNGQTCSITVNFAPLSSGIKTQNFELIYESQGVLHTKTRSLSGIASEPAVYTASVTPLNFGSRPVNSNHDLTLTISRTGNSTTAQTGTISGSTVFTFKGGTYPGTGGTCPTSSTFPLSCTVVFQFRPVAVATYSGTFSLNYNNGWQSRTLSVPLSGSGFPTARLVFSSATFDFGRVIQTTTSERTLTVTNSGTETASSMSFSNIASPFRYKGGSFPGTGGTCGTTLAVSQSCTLVMEYAPTTTGLTTRSFIVDYQNGYAADQSSATISGEGLAQAIISISEENPYVFGTTNVGSFIDKTFTLTNAGSVSGTGITGSFTSVFSFKGGTFPGTGGNCTTNLTAGSSCTIVLSFSPAAAIAYTGSFTLNYHDGLRIQTELKNLSGTGSAKLHNNDYFGILKPSYNRTFSLVHNGKIIESAQKKKWALQARGLKSGRLLYKIDNHLPVSLNYGPEIFVTTDNRFLIGIFKEDQPVGYDVISPETGDIYIRYLRYNEQ